MPQFDISSFNVQIFWLFVLFIGLYFLYVYKFLPAHMFLIKLRKKLVKSNTSSSKTPVIKDFNQLKVK